MNQIKKFAEEFFKNLKCEMAWDGEVLVVNKVPKGFEDLFGKSSPYRLSFVEHSNQEVEFVGKGSLMLVAMMKYLEGSGKATLLRIDFDVNSEAEIRKRVGLKNCEIASLTKGYKNNFFSRFSFVTSFNYLNESERMVSEIYIHEGKVVEGDLNGYTVVDGKNLSIDNEKVKRDYLVAKERVVDLAREKLEEVSLVLKKKAEIEIVRIGEHYDKALRELGGDLNGKLEKIREVELELRSCEEKNRDVLRKKIERLKGSLVKAGNDEAMATVEREKEMTIRDAMHKHSLKVDRKLVNTTVIYYPVYSFKICLEGQGNSKRFIEVNYDPLTKSFSGLDCEGCGKNLARINLCENGHICCEDCLEKCGECGGMFCVKCLRRICKVCGRKLCKACVKMCLGCSGVVCATHLRKDCVSGEDRCVSCLRACLRCHGMCEEKFFGVALDGSKVCAKCLGMEKSGKVLERVFRR